EVAVRKPHPPRVAKAPREVFVEARFSDERVVRRDPIGFLSRPAIDIDPEYRSQKILGDVLSVAAVVRVVPIRDVARPHIVASAAVAEGGIEIYVWTEHHRAAVVVALWFWHRESFTSVIGVAASIFRGPKFGKHLVVRVGLRRFLSGWFAVTEVERAVLLEIRMQGDPEQPLFAIDFGHPVGDVEKRLFRFSVSIEHEH